MNQRPHPDIGDVSELGQRYLDKQLQGSRLEGEFQLSSPGDIPSLAELTEQQREALRQRGLQTLPGKVAFGVLAAGASSRMALRDLPDSCRALLEQSGRRDLPSSKALVPVYRREGAGGAVLTFLDLFLENVRRFRGEHGVDNPAVMLASDANGEEIDAHLSGQEVDDVLVFRQPLAPQIAATREDVELAASNFQEPREHQQALSRAEWAGREVLIPKPAGHGEFLHQLVASGMLAALARRGVQYLSVRNIDNAAALLDDAWLTLLGYAAQEQLDCLLEVCPRLPGQSGGALIRQHGQWRIAEDPSFKDLPQQAEDSCYINNAVAIFRLDYFYKLYQTTADELRTASPQRLAEIAEATRRRFPVIVAAKPVKLSDGTVVAAVTPETNMWESTGVVRGARVGAFDVPSERAVGEDFLQLPREQRADRARRVRFSPTKNWDDYQNPLKRKILEGIADTLLQQGPAEA